MDAAKLPCLLAISSCPTVFRSEVQRRRMEREFLISAGGENREV